MASFLVVLFGFVAPAAHAQSANNDMIYLWYQHLDTPPSSLPDRPILAGASPLTFNFTAIDNLADMIAGNQGTPQQDLGIDVVQGFNDAADVWRMHFVDPITINIDIDFGPLGNGVLGGASSATVGALYSSVATALAGDVSPFSNSDATAVANLQPGPAIDFMTTDTTVVTTRDNDASANNVTLDVNRANAKAIGLLNATDAGNDVSITFTDFSDFMSPFSTNLNWDFDTSNGVGPTDIDFVGVATHEIGHGMGFVSGVDTVDFFSDPNGPGGPTLGPTQIPPIGPPPVDLNGFRVFSVWDMFRYTDDSLSQSGQPAGGLNDLALGEPTAGDTPFFSIDAGNTELATFSTGAFNGDGQQASHWKDNLGIGIMDPTISNGAIGMISALDLQAFDVMGYNPVPEPGGVLLIVFGALLAVLPKRRG